MKKKMKTAMLILCVVILTLAQPLHAFAVEELVDDEGYEHLVFGGHMCSDVQESIKHSLNPVNCYINFSVEENRPLWMAIYGAIQDWDWHLSYISQYMSEKQGYDRDIYGFSMACNEVVLSNADIRFYYIDEEIYDGDENVYALTTPYNALGKDVRTHVENRGNWRYSEICISQTELDDYSRSHTDEETEELTRRIINHEIGHALGLAHDTRDNGIIMYGQSDHELCEAYYYLGSNMTATVPTLHDLISVYLLYT